MTVAKSFMRGLKSISNYREGGKEMTEEQRQKALCRILCKWNKKEIDPNTALNKIWELYEKEALET